jgi:hypothetical protein
MMVPNRDMSLTVDPVTAPAAVDDQQRSRPESAGAAPGRPRAISHVRWSYEGHVRSVAVFLMLLCSALSCSSGDSTKPQPLVQNDVVGSWRCAAIGGEVVIFQTVFRPWYLGTWLQGSPDSCGFGQFELRVATPPDSFVGRHILCTADSLYWSDSSMVSAELTDRNHLWLRYLDQGQGNGWQFDRVLSP